MAAKLFRGNDRRMLLKMKKTIASMVARDVIAADPTPTKRISTRSPMFDLARSFAAVSEGQSLGSTITDYIDTLLAATL